MSSTWKKVVTEGSKADLSSLIIPSSKIKVTPLSSNQGGTITDKVLLHIQADGNIRVLDQDLLGTNNTTYATDGNTGLFNSEDDVFNIVEESFAEFHDLIPHYSGSSTTVNTTAVHYAWQANVDGQVIHSTNYDNTVLTNGTGVGNISYTTVAGDPQGLVSSSIAQAWTSVGDLGQDDDGSLTAGDIGTNTTTPEFNIDIGSQTINWMNSNANYGTQVRDIQFGTVNVVTGPTNLTDLTASNIIATGSSQFGTLGIEGEFVYGLGFYEMAISQMTSSVIMGNDLTNSHSFQTNLAVQYGITSSGFVGNGAGITNIDIADVTYGTLTMGDGFNKTSGFSSFNFQAPATMAILLNETGADPSGLFINSSNQLDISESGVRTNHFITESISGPQIPGYDSIPTNTNTLSTGEGLTSKSFNDNLLTNLPAHPSHSWAAGDSTSDQAGDHLLFENNESGNFYKADISQSMRDAIISRLPSYSNTAGTVTSITVVPTVMQTAIDGLYLGITNPTTDATMSIEDLFGGVNVDGTHWTSSAEENQYLSVINGGFGKGTKAESAQILLAGDFIGDALQFGNSINDVITIPGNLTVTNTEDTTTTIFKSSNLIISDSCFLLGAGSQNVVTDFGITFGQDPTQSNTIVYDSYNDGNKGRFGLKYMPNWSGGGQAYGNTALSSNHFVGVFSGSIASAESNEFDLDGNMRIADEEIYFFV